ncbi:mitochondrial basic amino acids transporter-like [Copidosoma floridanum]|uniref:mitochondrial basic amino acids transporter-like n=1 Tax=Copidosoma floridanum TaxID=29053 RepID=UPI0006C9B436|nr:mitochondrial basic amino acids transporter-like [Copidosoma floridanum]
MALDFFAGCLGGCAGIVVGYPLDTVKVHIQTQDHRNPKYRGTWHCFRTLLAQHSVAGLYRGMSSPMAGVAFINAVVFGIYGQSRKYLEQQQRQNEGSSAAELELSGHFVAGVMAGVAQSPVASPMELAKTRLQLQKRDIGGTTRAVAHGPVQCLLAIHRAKGLRGVFSGLGVTVLREAPSFGVYFASYELLVRSPNEPQRATSTWRVLLAGGLAGSASWIVSYPVDVVKSRLQADTSAKYNGAIDCFRKSVTSEGYGCLFRGLSSTILRAFPTNAATFAVVTWICTRWPTTTTP